MRGDLKLLYLHEMGTRGHEAKIYGLTEFHIISVSQELFPRAEDLFLSLPTIKIWSSKKVITNLPVPVRSEFLQFDLPLTQDPKENGFQGHKKSILCLHRWVVQGFRHFPCFVVPLEMLNHLSELS